MDVKDPRSFATPDDLDAWLAAHHATATELWVRMFKKGSGTPSVAWPDCVEACLRWGWIDGIRRSHDDVSFVQRLTPRRPKSTWSQNNCAIAERLIAAGRMQPAGLAHVEAAKKDGRWQQAYASSKNLQLPADLLAAIEAAPAAAQAFASLNAAGRFSLYFRLHNTKRPENREKQIAALVAKLAATPTKTSTAKKPAATKKTAAKKPSKKRPSKKTSTKPPKASLGGGGS